MEPENSGLPRILDNSALISAITGSDKDTGILFIITCGRVGRQVIAMSGMHLDLCWIMAAATRIDVTNI